MSSSIPNPSRSTGNGSFSDRPSESPSEKTIGRAARLVRTLAASAAVLVAASALTFVGATSASAQEITDAVTSVQIEEDQIESGRFGMKLVMEFSLGSGLDGTVQGGDTFWLKLDPKLSTTGDEFPIYDRATQKEVVAWVKTTGGTLATVTLTDYVNTRSFTTGAINFGVGFRDWYTPGGDYNLVFTSADREFKDKVNVTKVFVDPGDNLFPQKRGVWADNDKYQTKGQWLIRLPNGPADTMVFEDFGHVDGPGWEFDCTGVLENNPKNAYRVLRAPAHEVSFECSKDHVKWVIDDVPYYDEGKKNWQWPSLKIDYKVTDPSTAGDLVFVNRAQYIIDDKTPVVLDGEIRRTRGGIASGPTRPTTPTVTQAVCNGAAPTDPIITLPQNGEGVTYSLDNNAYKAGDTVEVTAELSPGYSWDEQNLPSGWELNRKGQAVLTIVLDTPICQSTVVPVAPEVTQATCDVGTGGLTTPTVDTTDTAEIHYSVDGLLKAGETVRVIAELQDATSNEWDDDLPPGWSVNSDGNAELSVVLDAPPCSSEIIPVAPDVTQATCIASTGDLTTPKVDVTNTSEIHYEVLGEEIAGETVRVVAELQDPASYEWDDDLPTGWSVNSDGNAELLVELDSPPCATAVVPLDPEVIQSVCITGSGNFTDPDVVATDTSEIHYEVLGNLNAGETVEVVAELLDTTLYEWDDSLPSGWSINGDGNAVRTVVLDAPTCASTVIPVSPNVKQASCIAGTGNLTDPSVITTDSNEIHYRVVGEEDAGKTVQVIAEIQDSSKFEWDDNLPSGWSVNGDGDAIRSILLDEPPCATAIVPVQPEVIQAVCTPSTGDLTDPTVNAIDTPEIDYRIIGLTDPGESVEIVAELKDSTLWEWDDDLPAGWSVNSDGDAIQTVVLSARQCTPTTHTPPGIPPGDTPPGPNDSPKDTLTKTGASGALLPFGLAIAGSCLGAALLLLRRRKSNQL